MAGVKGRSGGYRENATGGARKGAGRKPKTAPITPEQDETADIGAQQRKDALQFLEDVVNDPKAPLQQRVRAAIAAAQYRHTKKHDGGKRDDATERAKKAAAGKYAPSRTPLALVKR